MSRQSELVKKLDIDDAYELKILTCGSKLELKKVARDVIINGMTYEAAGEKQGLTKHAVYEFLKRLYKKKFGVDYGKD